MTYARERDLMRVARELGATSAGRTISELMAALNLSRRSVERMLDALAVYGVEESRSLLEGDHHLTKRWRLADPLPPVMQTLDEGERAALEIELGRLPDGPARQGLLKLLGGQERPTSGVATDIGTLIDRTAYLGTVGPSQRAGGTLIKTLERGIVGFEELKLSYRSEKRRTVHEKRVKPLGLLFSRFGYLVAFDRGRTPTTYMLNSILTAELTGKLFAPPKGFNLQSWAAESFGIYHGDERLLITLRFAPAVAGRAREVSFHQSEQKTLLKDGSLRVKLYCRGHRELFWELLHPDWIGRVRIEVPQALADAFEVYRRSA